MKKLIFLAVFLVMATYTVSQAFALRVIRGDDFWTYCTEFENGYTVDVGVSSTGRSCAECWVYGWDGNPRLAATDCDPLM